MSLVSTEPSQVIDIGWQRFETEALDPNHPHRIKNQKAAHKFAAVLGQNPNKSGRLPKFTILIVSEIG